MVRLAAAASLSDLHSVDLRRGAWIGGLRT